MTLGIVLCLNTVPNEWSTEEIIDKQNLIKIKNPSCAKVEIDKS